MVCVTTGLLRRLDGEELEGVLSHELAHVAHRDVLVMTVASFVGVVAGVLTRSWMWSGMGRRRDSDSNGAAAFLIIMLVVDRRLRRSASCSPGCCRATASCPPTAPARCSPGSPAALARALQKITGEMGAIPTKDLREKEAMNAFFIAPAFGGRAVDGRPLFVHPPAAGAAPGAAGPHPAQLGQ